MLLLYKAGFPTTSLSADTSLVMADPTGAPIPSGDVIKYLVQSEPLNLVTEISGYVDQYSLERGHSAIDSLHGLLEAEKRLETCVDQLEEAQGLSTTIGKLLNEADDVISSRLHDLQSATSLLCNDPPLTTPPALSPGANPLAQTASRVEEVVTAQERALNDLENDRDSLSAAVCEVSNRGKSLKSSLDALLARTRDLSRLPSVRDKTHLMKYRSLCGVYQRRSLCLIATIDRVVENSEAIRELRRNPRFDTIIDSHHTLAEELMVRHTRRPETISALRLGLLPREARGVDVRLLRIWVGCLIRDCVDYIFSFIPPLLRDLAFLFASIVVFGVLAWQGGRVGGSGYGTNTSQPPVSSSIRDLLLAGKTAPPDDLVRNLVPKRR